MFGNDQNLKDPEGKSETSYGAGTSNLSLKNDSSMSNKNYLFAGYPKLSKLITALYMVTDIMDKDEPIRLNLRTLGAEILSDISLASRTEMNQKIYTLMSFMDIARAVNLISEMNFNILKREFNQLGNSLSELSEPAHVNHLWLEDFLSNPPLLEKEGVGGGNSGVTTYSPPHRDPLLVKEREQSSIPNNSKNQRREEIIKVIKDSGGSATIADVKIKAFGSLVTCGEKTLQRELVAMVRDGVLDKTGEKRWSKYFLKNQ